MACYYGLLVATVAGVPEHLHICGPLTRGRTHARFTGPSATCGRAVSYSCSLVVASNNYARHCARRVLGIVQVNPPTPGDLKNTPKHRFFNGFFFWSPSCLIRQPGSGPRWEIDGDRVEIAWRSHKTNLTHEDETPNIGDAHTTWNHLEALKWPQTVPHTHARGGVTVHHDKS